MDEVKAKKSKTTHHDRVGLDQTCLKRVDSWIDQVNSAAKGIVITRKDIINWLIKQHDEVLSPNELNKLKSQYFSDVRFLQQAMKDLRAAKKRGDAVNLSEILGETINLKSSPLVKRLRKRKVIEATTSEKHISEDLEHKTNHKKLVIN